MYVQIFELLHDAVFRFLADENTRDSFNFPFELKTCRFDGKTQKIETFGIALLRPSPKIDDFGFDRMHFKIAGVHSFLNLLQHKKPPFRQP